MLSEKALLTSRAMRRVENTKVALDAFHDTFDSLVWGVINRGENHVVATWNDLGFAGDDPEACWDASKDHFINELIELGYEVEFAYKHSIYNPSTFPFGLIIAWGEGKKKMPALQEEYDNV